MNHIDINALMTQLIGVIASVISSVLATVIGYFVMPYIQKKYPGTLAVPESEKNQPEKNEPEKNESEKNEPEKNEPEKNEPEKNHSSVVTDSSQDGIPTEARGWNWGAAFLGWIWSIGNRAWTSILIWVGMLLLTFVIFIVLCFVFLIIHAYIDAVAPNNHVFDFNINSYTEFVLGFVLFLAFYVPNFIIFGRNGNKWAWKAKDWKRVEDFKRVQRIWGWIGFGIFIFQLLNAIANLYASSLQ